MNKWKKTDAHYVEGEGATHIPADGNMDWNTQLLQEVHRQTYIDKSCDPVFSVFQFVALNHTHTFSLQWPINLSLFILNYNI